MENIIEFEETVFDKINGLTAEVNQMKKMYDENIRLIGAGDDIEGRKYLNSHLENEIMKKEYQIKKLQEQLL